MPVPNANPLLILCLDAVDRNLLEQWIRAGELPNLARLMRLGTYVPLERDPWLVAESSFNMALTGCEKMVTGHWGSYRFDAENYRVSEGNYYAYDEYPPFFAMGEQVRAAIFDVPQVPICRNLNGVQVVGWGAHAPDAPTRSQPAGLLEELCAKHGRHPALHNDGVNWWRHKDLAKLYGRLCEGIERRFAILEDLFTREPWDLMVSVFGELHSAGHAMFHHSQPNHPLYHEPCARRFEFDPMLGLLKKIDDGIQRLLERLPSNVRMMIFAQEGVAPNAADLCSNIHLGELCYRLSFPGRRGVHSSSRGEPLPNGDFPSGYRFYDDNAMTESLWRWFEEPNAVRRLLRRYAPKKLRRTLDRLGLVGNAGGLLSPHGGLRKLSPGLRALPAMIYRDLWSKMKFFALPSFSQGTVRVNLRGRESAGLVSPAEYRGLLDDLSEKLLALRDPRTGDAVVKEVWQTREEPLDANPHLPAGDLLVDFHPRAVDVVESEAVDRIGPFRFYRTGGHLPHGFCLLSGAGIPAGARLPVGGLLDIGPTAWRLLGLTPPAYMQGQSLFQSAAAPRAA